MKKEKGKYTFLLIIGVAVIWGVIAYRFYKGINGAEQLVTQNSLPNLTPEIERNDDDYILNLSYEDPFRIGRLKSRVTGTRHSNQSQNDNIRDPKETKSNARQSKVKVKLSKSAKSSKTVWPAIQYFGLVKDKGSSLFLLQIERKVIHLKRGEIYEEIVLKKGDQDSVLITFMKEEKYVKRK